MRRIGRGISRSSHIPDHVSAVDRNALLQALRVSIQMGVVEAEDALVVKLVNGQSARFAQKEFLNDAIVHGQDRGAAGRNNISRLVRLSAGSILAECVMNVAGIETANRQAKIPPQEKPVIAIRCS